MLLLARFGLPKTLAAQHNKQNTTINTNTSINVKATAEINTLVGVSSSDLTYYYNIYLIPFQV